MTIGYFLFYCHLRCVLKTPVIFVFKPVNLYPGHFFLNSPHKLKHAATVIFSIQKTLNVLLWEQSCLSNSPTDLSIRITQVFENVVNLEILLYSGNPEK